MKYVSLDLETTCADEKKPENILQVSIVVEDPHNVKPLNELPHFTCFVKPKRINGDAYALGMNGWILDIISGRAEGKHPIYKGDDWVPAAVQFLAKHFPHDRRIPVAGKNVAGFDKQFLPKILDEMLEYRTIDPGSVFWDPYDEKMQGLGQIKEQLGISGEVTHDAYDDAIDVIKVLRKKYVQS